MEFSSHRKSRLRRQTRSSETSTLAADDFEGCNGGAELRVVGVGVTSFASPSRRPLLQPGASVESTSSVSEPSATAHHFNWPNNEHEPRQHETWNATTTSTVSFADYDNGRTTEEAKATTSVDKVKLAFAIPEAEQNNENEIEKRRTKTERRRKKKKDENIIDASQSASAFDPNSQNLVGFADLLEIEKGKSFQVS